MTPLEFSDDYHSKSFNSDWVWQTERNG